MTTSDTLDAAAETALEILDGLTIAQIREGLETGRFTAEALAKAALARIDAQNGKWNAVIFRNDEGALAAARDVDRRRAAGEPLGPLAGVPIVVKDPMDMVGFPSTAGWERLHAASGGVDLMPERDSPVVARMRAADAVILGKTNVPILSWTGTHANDSWAGPTLNPAAPDRVPGGSSAGTAAAVASGMAVVGLAEETGGSIQNPASAQGLVGIKPTIGLVPNAGVVPLSGNRDVVGPIARNVEDAALCLDALAGFTTEDPKTLASVGKIPASYAEGLSAEGLKGKRLGLYGPGWRKDELAEEAVELYEAAKKILTAAGAELIEDPFAGTEFNALRQITPGTPFFDGRGLESIAWDMTCYLRRLGPDAALKTWDDFVANAGDQNPIAEGANLNYLWQLPDFVEAMKSPSTPPAMPDFEALKAKYLQLMEEVFAKHQLDGLVYPQMLQELPLLHSGEAILETTVGELNIGGFPGITAPAGAYASGAPFCLIFLGLQWSEAELIKMVHAFEKARDAA